MSTRTSYLDNYPSPYGVFRNLFVFSDIRRFLTGQTVWKKSEYITKGNISCRFMLRNNYIREGIGFYVEWKIGEGNENPWRLEAQIIFKLINQLDESRTRGYELKYFGDPFVPFDNEMGFTGIPNVLPVNTILDEEQGFLMNNKLKLVLDVRVNTIEGFYSPKVFNFYEPFKKSAETVHLFGTLEDIHRISHNKTLAAVHSMHFPNFFAHNRFDEWNVFGFESFLRVLHGEMTTMQSEPAHLSRREKEQSISDIPQLLLFAKACKVHTVKRKCEDFIVKTHYPIIPEEYFEFAIQHNLRRVLHAYLRIIPAFDKSILKRLNVQSMPGETMKAIMNRIFGFHEEI
ncbi:unnamed protein product [Caenorhabditis brenneri]